MDIDYKAIGKRIKTARLKMDITQMKLAEISEQTPTNISHVETGNTKVSLPTLISIANALNVTVDNLLCDNIIQSKNVFENEIAELLSDCDEREIRIIAQITKATKNAIRSNLKR